MVAIGGAKDQPQSLCLFAAGNLAQVFKEGACMRWGEVLIGELVLREKGHEMEQIEAVSRQRIGRVASSAQMPHEAGDNGNGPIVIVQELKGHVMVATGWDTVYSQVSLAPLHARTYVLKSVSYALPGCKCLHNSIAYVVIVRRISRNENL